MSSKFVALLWLATGLIFITTPSIAQDDSGEGALVEASRKQLAGAYLSAPLPCADPWLAGDDNRITATPAWAEAQGLRAGDVLSSIAGRRVVPGEPDAWLRAMRGLPDGLVSFEVVVSRNGQDVKTRISCQSHVPYFQAEKRVWTTIGRRDWSGCAAATAEAMDAFGKRISPMMYVQLQCGLLANWPFERLRRVLYDYSSLLIDELPALTPQGQAESREEVTNSISVFEKAGAAGYANELRNRLAALSAGSLPATQSQPTEAQLVDLGSRIAVAYGFVPKTPKGQIVETWAKQVLSEPLVISHASKLERDQDSTLWFRQLVNEGMPFLPDLYLKRRAEILVRMLDLATPAQCAQLAGHSRYGGNDVNQAIQATLPRLSETDVGVYFEVTREAMMVRLRQTQFVPYVMSQEESEGLIVLIAQAVPEAERERWISQLQRVDSLTDSAYCEASKSMYRAILALTGPQASRGLRIDFSK